MSRSYEVDYSLIRQRRQEANENRVRENTRRFLEGYQEQLDRVRDEGLAEYVSDEYDRLEDLLREAWNLLDDDPFEARNVSREIQGSIRGIGRRARETRNDERAREREAAQERRAAERAARQEERERRREERERAMAAERERRREEIEAARERRREEVEAEQERRREEIEAARAARAARTAFVSGMFGRARAAIPDPVAFDLVRDRVDALADRFSELANAEGCDLRGTAAAFEGELGALAVAAREEAARWRADDMARHETEDAVAGIDDRIEVVRRSATPANRERIQSVLDGLAGLRERLRSGAVDAKRASEEADAAVDRSVAELVNEDVRRETLLAIVGTVRSLGFVLLGAPGFTEDGGVLVHARRPSGEECQFVVRADGGMRYAFENYAGTACRKDCAQVEAMLRETYGVVLSNERVIWENPDEIGKDSFRAGDGATTKGGL